jgi:hypothetical protein
MNRLYAALAGLGIIASGAALAQEGNAAAEAAPSTPVEKPSAEAVKSFWSFYFKGKGQGVVLADAKLCLEVAKEGDNKSECVKEVPAEGVKAGTVVNVWQAYLVPQGDNVEDITIRLKLGDEVRETKDVKVNGASIRYRSWNAVRIPKPGNWTVDILRGGETLKSMSLVATK